MFQSTDGQSHVLDAIRIIMPDIARSAEATEAARGVAPALLERLEAAGLFRMMVPKRLGGEELSPLQVLRVVEELAAADASVGWTAMVANGFNAVMGLFPSAGIDEFMSAGPDLKMRGALAPKGRLVEVEGGYRISGRWPFASGSYEYDWVVGSGLLFDGQAPRMVDGQPVLLIAAVRPDEAQFLDTWNSVGMRGSASHDFILDDVFVPSRRVAPLMGTSNLETAIHRLPFPAITAGQHVAVSTGCAIGALADLATLAQTKCPAFKPDQTLANDPVFQHKFGELSARLDCLRAYADRLMQDSWALACGDTAVTPADVARIRAMCTKVSLECVDLVNDAMTLAGSTIAYSDHPMQRRWRDVRVAAQHAAASGDNLTDFGIACLTRVQGEPSATAASAAC